MFGRRIGRSVRGGVSLGTACLVALGMMAGCNGKKTTDVTPPEEVAAALVQDAKAALNEGKLDDAESYVEKAKAAFAGVDLGTLEDDIAKAREAVAEVALKKEVDALLADGKAALDAKNYDEAITKAKAALDKDPGNADAEQLQSDAEAAKEAAAAPKEDPKAEFAKVKQQYDTALRGGRHDEAIGLITRYNEWARKAGEDPLAGNTQAKIEAMKLVEQARPLVNSREVPQLDRAIRLLDDAKRKDPANADVAGLLKQANDRKAARNREIEGERVYSDAMAEGRRLAREDRVGAVQQAIEAFQKAERVAPDAARRNAARDAAAEASKKVTYLDNLQKAQQAVGRNDLDAASEFIAKALEVRRTREARDLQDTIEGKLAEKAGDAAAEAKDWAAAVEKYEDAESRNIDVADKLAKARQMMDVGAVADKITYFAEKGEALQWGTVAEEYAGFVKDHADNAEVAALGKKYPLPKEKKELDKAAAGEYKAIKAEAANPELRDRPQEKIAIYERGLPKVRGSRYEGMLNNDIKRERDGIFRGRFTEVRNTATGMNDPAQLDEKISYLTQMRPEFENTTFLTQIDGMLTAAKNQRAMGAYNQLKQNANQIPAEQIDDKIAMLERAAGEEIYKGSRYEDMIAKDISAAKTAKATSYYQTLMSELPKAPEEQDAKIAKLEDALRNPVYEGTRQKDMIAASLKREKDAKARPALAEVNKRVAEAPTPAEKLAILEGEINNAIFAGTSLKDQIQRNIDTQKNAVKQAEFTELQKAVSDREMSGEAKIEKLSAAKPSFAGTRFESQIDSMIDRERNTMMTAAFNELRNRVTREIESRALKIAELEREKPKYAGTRYEQQIERMIQTEKDLDAGDKYKELTARVKDLSAEERIRELESAKPGFAGTKYEAMIERSISTEKTNLKSSLYKELMQELNNPEAGRDSAAKAEFLKSKRGDFADTTFEKQIDAQITKFEGLIEREKAAAERAKAAEEAAAERAKAAEAEAAAKAVFAEVRGSLVKATTPAECDENIQKLLDAQQKVAGTRVAGQIEAQLKSQRALKEKLEAAAQPE